MYGWIDVAIVLNAVDIVPADRLATLNRTCFFFAPYFYIARVSSSAPKLPQGVEFFVRIRSKVVYSAYRDSDTPNGT